MKSNSEFPLPPINPNPEFSEPIPLPNDCGFATPGTPVPPYANEIPTGIVPVGEPYVTITFRANLTPPGPQVIQDYQSQFKVAYLPGVGRMTQGDVFTLYGDAAVYARRTYTSGVVGDYLSYPLQIVSSNY